jgi:hypothetical protein
LNARSILAEFDRLRIGGQTIDPATLITRVLPDPEVTSSAVVFFVTLLEERLHLGIRVTLGLKADFPAAGQKFDLLLFPKAFGV